MLDTIVGHMSKEFWKNSVLTDLKSSPMIRLMILIMHFLGEAIMEVLQPSCMKFHTSNYFSQSTVKGIRWLGQFTKLQALDM